MVMSRNQNAGGSHNINIDDSSFETVEQFKYLGTTLTYQNSIQEEINSRLKSGNTCYHSVQNLYLVIQKYKNIQNYNFPLCFLWVWKSVAHNEEGT